MEKLKKIYSYVCFTEELLAGMFLVAIMVLIFASGFARSVGHPLSWSMDAATFLFAWVVFFSADVALRKDRHISIEALTRYFPQNLQRNISIINYLLIVIFLGFLICYGIVLAYTSRFRTFQGIPGFSYMWVTLSVPIGSLLILITTIIKGKDLIQNTNAGAQEA
jgi:TRAP-type C4-dicarboxylate transport system permease small subunit